MNRDNQPNQTERQLPANLLAWIAVITVGLGIIAFVYSMQGSSRPATAGINPDWVAVSLPKMAATIAAGEVKELVIQDNLLVATKTDGTKLTARKEANISALETLRVLGVPAETLLNLPVTVEAEQDDSGGFGPMSFLSMFLLLAFLGLFIFRGLRPSPSSNSLFNNSQMGRSNPRIITGGSDKHGQDAASKNLPPPVTFRHVAGAEQAKLELQEVVEFLKEPAKFVKLGARVPRGVLMAGPPGTGKTLLAKAVAGEAMVPFFSISGSEFVEMFVGVGAARVRDLFKRAREQAPAVIFVDEIDAVGRRRGANFGSGNDEREQTLNQILVEMDGFPTDVNVIVMASTNRPDILDPALLRPGRFDRKVILDQPDVHAREAILEIHARGKPLAPDISLPALARLTPGFVGADLENLVNEAAILAARRNLNLIGRLEFQDAMERIVAGPERQSKILSDYEREVVAYHEAGHALVMHHLDQCDPVHKVSIVSRGMALGYTMPLPNGDKYLRSRQAFEDEITGLLGGRAAEEIIFHQITTGAANDLDRATKLARAMVTRFGFSEKLGLRTFGEEQGNPYLGQLGGLRDYSEEMAQLIDHEIHQILERAYERAKTIITNQQCKLVNLTQALLEHETVERLEFEALMA